MSIRDPDQNRDPAAKVKVASSLPVLDPKPVDDPSRIPYPGTEEGAVYPTVDYVDRVSLAAKKASKQASEPISIAFTNHVVYHT